MIADTTVRMYAGRKTDLYVAIEIGYALIVQLSRALILHAAIYL